MITQQHMETRLMLLHEAVPHLAQIAIEFGRRSRHAQRPRDRRIARCRTEPRMKPPHVVRAPDRPGTARRVQFDPAAGRRPCHEVAAEHDRAAWSSEQPEPRLRRRVLEGVELP